MISANVLRYDLDETVLYVVYFLKRMYRLDLSSIGALDTTDL